MKTIPLLLVTLAVLGAAASGWYIGRQQADNHHDEGKVGRKLLYYQSAMHPWIKSEQPGKCTICGMDLTPVYEGDQAPEATSGVVVLSSNSIQVIHARAEAVARRSLERRLRVAGVIDDNDAKHRFISAYVEGRIDELFVNYLGQEVQAGQPLARIYSPTLLASVREYRSLLKTPGSLSSAASNFDQAPLLQAAAMRLRQLGLTESQIAALHTSDQEDTIHVDLVAPVSGTVVGRSIYAGQYVKEGDRLFEMADLSTMWFMFDVYEPDLTWISVGQAVEITSSALPQKILRAPVTFIDPTINELTRAAKVRVELDNPIRTETGSPRRELFHQLFAEGRVHVVSEPVLALPRQSVLYPGGSPVVYVEHGGGAYEQRSVRLGRRGDRHWEVLEGVSEGERVVVAANFLIDAQAQLDASIAESAIQDQMTHKTSMEGGTSAVADQGPANISRLAEPQVRELAKLFHAASAVAAALAADDLKAFRRDQAQLVELGQSALATPDIRAGWKTEAGVLQQAFMVLGQDDLTAARRWFLPVSHALVAMARQARRALTDFATVRIYHCPMVNQAWAEAPKDGFWIQTSGPLRNPYFGAEMLDCGREEKP